MSVGSPVLRVRCPLVWCEEIEKDIASKNHHSPNEPLDMSKWLMQAIKEKLKKSQRGKKVYGKKLAKRLNSRVAKAAKETPVS